MVNFDFRGCGGSFNSGLFGFLPLSVSCAKTAYLRGVLCVYHKFLPVHFPLERSK